MPRKQKVVSTKLQDLRNALRECIHPQNIQILTEAIRREEESLYRFLKEQHELEPEIIEADEPVFGSVNEMMKKFPGRATPKLREPKELATVFVEARPDEKREGAHILRAKGSTIVVTTSPKTAEAMCERYLSVKDVHLTLTDNVDG